MSEWLFFGDSLTEGSNCECAYPDFILEPDKVVNLGYSGTTIGEYSIYPVDGHSLLSMIGANKDRIRHADKIFIEYGSNDVSAVMCGFATVQTVIVSFVKAIDWIRQLNTYASIYFLEFGNADIISNRGKRMCDYLKHDYFKQFNFEFPETVYQRTYIEIVDNISKVCDIITMFDYDMLKDMDKYISDDNIHPNVEGHKRIAENILKQFGFR